MLPLGSVIRKYSNDLHCYVDNTKLSSLDKLLDLDTLLNLDPILGWLTTSSTDVLIVVAKAQRENLAADFNSWVIKIKHQVKKSRNKISNHQNVTKIVFFTT
jgi:hypothetical protein